MTHGVNPAVKEVETPDAAAMRDRVMVESSREQLAERDYPMLPRSHPRDENVG